MSRFKFYNKQFKIMKDDIYLLPTIRININNRVWWYDNFSIEFHFLVFHARIVFMDKRWWSD